MNILRFVFVVISIVIDLYCAFILSKLWMWFLVPIFSLRPIGILESYGLLLIASLVHSSRTASKIAEEINDSDEDEAEKTSKRLIFRFLFINLLLITGFIIKSIS
jgi:hypothetical protein